MHLWCLNVDFFNKGTVSCLCPWLSAPFCLNLEPRAVLRLSCVMGCCEGKLPNASEYLAAQVPRLCGPFLGCAWAGLV